MPTRQFYTAGTIGSCKADLLSIRAGPCWVYADTYDTFAVAVEEHARKICALLQDTLLLTIRELGDACRSCEVLSAFEDSYIHFVADAACASGLAGKLLSRGISGRVYPVYFANEWTENLNDTLDVLWDELSARGTLQFRQAALVAFGEQEEHRLARVLLEHLVFLNVAVHAGKWAVRI